MATGRMTPFSPGRRWRVDQKPGDKYRDRPFDFVIVGPGTKPDRKLCRIEVVGHTDKCCQQCHHGLEQEYTHKHLKKHAALVPHQQLLWIGSWQQRDGAVTLPMADPVPLVERPKNVWTLYLHTDEKSPPELPFRPVHHVNAFVEDEMHDWRWERGRFYYRSRVMDRPVWVLVEYER